jgi:signal recognition particle GTPase
MAADQAGRHRQRRHRFRVQQELGVPVKLVGLLEGPDDLAPFEPAAFVDALLGCGARENSVTRAKPASVSFRNNDFALS